MSSEAQATNVQRKRRKFFVPEAIQTSAMDCGPACLKSVLEGFGVPVSYGRLREICHTSIDGTAVSSLEAVLNDLGLEASETIVPAEHLLMAKADVMPAIAITVQPAGLLHFVTVWRRVGPFLQIMDPLRGRHWIHHRKFTQQLHSSEVPVPQQAIEEFINDADLQDVVATRWQALGCSDAKARLKTAAQSGWNRFAQVEGALRFGERLHRDGGFTKAQAGHVVDVLSAAALADDSVLPQDLRFVSAAASANNEDDAEPPVPMVKMRGPVVVMIEGRKTNAAAHTVASAALRTAEEKPRHVLWRLLQDGGRLVPLLLLMGVLAAGVGALIETLLFRAFFELSRRLPLFTDRVLALSLVAVFATALLLIEWPTAVGLAALGRRLEGGLRRAFVNKLPVFPDAYFQSRPVSDMATRAHQIHQLRALPFYVGQILRVLCELLATTVGVIWLHPQGTVLALMLLAAVVALPLLLHAGHEERDMRLRAQAGALSVFYLDALLGLQAVRAHAGETALQREHSARLVDWARAAWQAARYAVRAEALTTLVAYGLALWLLFDHLFAAHGSGWALLLVYWTLTLPALGQEFAFLLQQIPRQKNLVARLLEPLQAKELAVGKVEQRSPAASGVAIAFENLRVHVGGHEVLAIDELQLPAGTQIALVGASGSGKSSFLSVIQGFHAASEGTVTFDGQPQTTAHINTLREHTVWVDPQVSLWNQSLLENLRYGAANPDVAVGAAIEDAELDEVLARLPTGLESMLGEGGGLLSGGEGQRVRLGRNIQRSQVRLVLFDEAFRGLERPRRQRLLARARERWQHATFICATHDVSDALMFDRVLVLEGGRVAEDSAPAALAANPSSLFARFLAVETALQEKFASPTWRRWSLNQGVLHCENPDQIERAV